MSAQPPKSVSEPVPAPQPGAPSTPRPRLRSARTLAALGAVLLLTFLVYTPALDNDFTNWDDEVYVTENALVRNPSDLAAFVNTPVHGNRHPLTMYSLALDYARYRDYAPGFHLTSVLFHLANTALVFAFIWLLSGSRFWTSLLTALLFGIHPMHVESVAWIAERKDVLYAFFYLLALIAYVPYAAKPRVWLLGVCLVAFALSLASKPAAVVLPLSLLAVDYLRKRPWSWRWILEKLPFFALSLWVGWLTLHTQTEIGAVVTTRWNPFEKLLFASYGILMYVVKLFWPFRLSAIYPYPEALTWGSAPVFFLALPIVLLAVAVLFRYGRRNRPLIFGAAFFLINVVLVLQFFTIGQAVMADRYTYLPYIGLTLALTWCLDDFRQPRGRTFRTALATAVGVVVAISLWQTPVRCEVWKNSVSLWNDVIAKYPDRVAVAYNNRAYSFRSTGQLDRELAEYDHAIALYPNYAAALSNRGSVLAMRGDYAGAMRDFDAAIRANPRYAQAYEKRAVVLSQLKRYEEAIADFRKLLELTPGNALILISEIGVCYMRLDRPQEALAEFNRAIALDPNSGPLYFNRSVAWERLGERARALEDARRAQSLGVAGNDPGRIERLSRPGP